MLKQHRLIFSVTREQIDPSEHSKRKGLRHRRGAGRVAWLSAEGTGDGAAPAVAMAPLHSHSLRPSKSSPHLGLSLQDEGWSGEACGCRSSEKGAQTTAASPLGAPGKGLVSIATAKYLDLKAATCSPWRGSGQCLGCVGSGKSWFPFLAGCLKEAPPSSELWEFGRKRLRVGREAPPRFSVRVCVCMYMHVQGHVCEPAKVHMCTRAVSIQMCTLHARVNLPVCTGACLCVRTRAFMCWHMHYIGERHPTLAPSVPSDGPGDHSHVHASQAPPQGTLHSVSSPASDLQITVLLRNRQATGKFRCKERKRF